MSKRIGILTFSAAHNFGAVLQCYGLWATLRGLGHDARVIDYRPRYLATWEPRFGLRNWLNPRMGRTLRVWRNYRYWRAVYDGYVCFKSEEMAMSPPCFSADELGKILKDYDTIIVGSDQVWNNQFNGNDPVWYGLEGSPCRWVAYGASCGNLQSWLESTDLSVALSLFHAVGVRERDLCVAIAQSMPEKHPYKVLDPSLLASSEVWNRWTNRIVPEKYILIYQARECDNVFRVASMLSNQLGGCRLIPVDFYNNVKKLGYQTFMASPKEFVSLVKNAECVVTTSFHGTAFSILLHTPFYTLRLDDGADGRAADLLSQVGLSCRMIGQEEEVRFAEVDFTEADQRLKQLRNESLTFLKNALK